MRRLLVAVVAFLGFYLGGAAQRFDRADASRASAVPGAADVLVPTIDGYETGADAPGALGSVTRPFTGEQATITIFAVPVDASFEVEQLFEIVVSGAAGTEAVPAPEFGLASWIVQPGMTPADGGPLAVLAVGTEGWIFVITVADTGTGSMDTFAEARTVARSQIERVGGTVRVDEGVNPSTLATTTDPALTALLPGELGPLQVELTAAAGEPIGADTGLSDDVFAFLDEHTSGVVRVWTGAGTNVAASVTSYPYEVFAAAALGQSERTAETRPVPDPGVTAPGWTWFEGIGPRVDQIGVVFRREQLFVVVLSDTVGRDRDASTAAVTAVAAAISESIGDGNTSAYRLPGRRTTFQALGMSSVFVTGGTLGAVGIGRSRARRTARRAPDGSTIIGSTGATGDTIIELDADASRLRRMAGVVLLGQLVFVNVGIGALAGDFGWRGAEVAALAFAAGIGFTAWWRNVEHRVVGPSLPRRRRILPRPAGIAVGLLAAALLGVGIGFGVKGIRYLVLPPGLAQLKWSDFFDISPTAVGIVFSVGGLAVAAIGSALFRVARAFARAGTQQTLAADDRSPLLYLRSFSDDRVQLATIVSARRPFLELFSVRGADPFEESLAWELCTYGPVVAVARPGGPAASLGAAREYLPDATWQEQVGERMADAAAIVVAIGDTAGLQWELRRLVAEGHLARTIFVFPPVEAGVLAERWASTSSALTDAGVAITHLGVPIGTVHTTSIRADGTLATTVAGRRDDATYRTAIDRAIAVVLPTA